MKKSEEIQFEAIQWFIYKITNVLNNKVYIGQTKRSLIKDLKNIVILKVIQPILKMQLRDMEERVLL